VLHWPHGSIHPHYIEPQARLALSGLQRHYNVNNANVHEQLQRESSVVIFPVIQAGQFNIREEEECLRQLFGYFGAANSRDFRPLLNLTSGYFGLFKSYKNLILRSRIPTRIICASPKVGFPVSSIATNNLMLFIFRQMAFTIPREYLAVCQGVTRGSSSSSWQPCASLKFKTPSPFLDP